MILDHKVPEVLFYSEDWKRTRVFTFSKIPCFDILITKDYLNLIKLPSSLSVGLAVLPVGPIIGTAVSNSVTDSDKKIRDKRRSSWLDSNHKLVSMEYEKRVSLKIPREKLKNALLLKKSFGHMLAVFTYNGEKITLKGSKKEYERFRNYIESTIL